MLWLQRTAVTESTSSRIHRLGKRGHNIQQQLGRLHKRGWFHTHNHTRLHCKGIARWRRQWHRQEQQERSKKRIERISHQKIWHWMILNGLYRNRRLTSWDILKMRVFWRWSLGEVNVSVGKQFLVIFCQISLSIYTQPGHGCFNQNGYSISIKLYHHFQSWTRLQWHMHNVLQCVLIRFRASITIMEFINEQSPE